MYINHRDQIKYHGFLKSVRLMQNATMNQLSEGICSYSEISRVEIGDRLPEKLMRDRITSRLGISGEEYEEYLRPEEYRQWQCRMRILDAINKENVEAVEKEIAEYDKMMERNPVQEQFLETMRYMYMQMKGVSSETLALLLELAILHTVPNIKAAFEGAQLLADQELNLILEYTYQRSYLGEDEFLWRLTEYQKILDYVERSHMDAIGKSKIYPKTSYYICNWILEKNPSEENLQYALKLCNESIELLQEVNRLYYFVEFMECRQRIIKQLVVTAKLTEAEKESLQLLKEKDFEWETLLKELYAEYDVPAYMKNFTYLYVETEGNSAVEVIRIRRRMVKMSRAKVSKNICTEKTIERFENYENSPSMVILRDVFEKVGLCGEYRRARVISSEAEALDLWNKVADRINAWDHKESEAILEELEKILHMEIVFNSQEIGRLRNLLAYRMKKLDSEQLYQEALKILEYTLSFESLVRKEEIYLTRAELDSVYDLAFKMKGDVSKKCYSIIERLCKEMLPKDMNACRLTVFETLMGELSSILGDKGQYEESLTYSEKLMKESLTHRRSVVLIDNLYNKLWVYEQQLTEHEMYANTGNIRSLLLRCITLSQINKRSNWTNFLQQKLSRLGNSN